MNIIPYLIGLPFIVAVLCYLIRNDKLRNALAVISVIGIWVMAAWLAGAFFGNDCKSESITYANEIVDIVMSACEVLLMIVVTFLSFKYKKYPVCLLSIIPTAMLLWVEYLGPERAEAAEVYVDRLSMILCIIVALIGGMIVVYATGYMNAYHKHHSEVKNRNNYFFALLFVFLGAMFGLVLSDSLIWMCFFWEITSVCSFLLIGYTRSDEAINNSFRALWMNLLGGFAFATAIVIAAVEYENVSLANLVAIDNERFVMIPIMLLAFAALTKSAQFPFSTWLLGAMVAPTPTSALLHSATMVKAGCFLLLRLAPALAGSVAGLFISAIGAFTFIMASFLAISQSDGKKVLAYSTVSNLGLIVTCAGVGSAGAVWAGVFLLIFHAVTKSLLFQCVGAVENSSHSRDIENMDGLIKRLPKLAGLMILGIVGMYLAPFGMLIFKWAALKAFIDAGLSSVFLVIVIAFGSSTTLFYWTKWLCKLVSFNSECTPCEDITNSLQYISLFFHAVMVVVLCVSFSFISDFYVEPYVESVKNENIVFLSKENLVLMFILVVSVFVVPAVLRAFTKNAKRRTVMAYVAGVNRQGGRAFMNAHGDERHLELSNWYLEDYFGEAKLLPFCKLCGAVILITSLVLVIGGALL